MTSWLSFRGWSDTFWLRLLALLVILAAPAARADSPTLSARVECARASAPGRILCELSAQASSGRLVWVDALVVQAPPFARPLRARVVAAVNPEGVRGTASAKLALVASELGTGELKLRVRAVLCHEGSSGEWCGPEETAVSAAVEVGQASSNGP